MQHNREKSASWPIIYPFVLVGFPILTLHLTNFGQVTFAEVLPLLIANLMALSLLWFIGNKFISSKRKTALILSVAWILFFSTGRFFPSITYASEKWLGVDLPREVLLHFSIWLKVSASIFISIFLAIIYLTLRTKSELEVVTGFMNVSSAGLLVLLVTQYIITGLQHLAVIREFNDSHGHSDVTSDLVIGTEITAFSGGAPDIYYLILDGYGRGDILQKYYLITSKMKSCFVS